MFAEVSDDSRVSDHGEPSLGQEHRRTRVVSIVELAKAPSPTWMVQGLVFESSIALFAGKKATFKTFVLLGVALCVATGSPWQGRPTKQGPVVYLAAEGGRGLPIRARAWCTNHEVEFGALAGRLWIITHPYKLNHPKDVEEMIAEIRALGVEPELFVIDTLARTIDGDENESAVMRRYIDGCDRLKDEFNATICVIHHVGKSGRSPRGSSVSECDVDTVILLERTKTKSLVKITCDKQKDADEFEPFSLERVEVQFGEDEYGSAGESCVMRLTNSAGATTSKPADPHRQHRPLCLAIAKHDTGAGCTTTVAMTDYSSPKTFYRHLANAKDAELVEEVGQSTPQVVRLTPAGRVAAVSPVSRVSNETDESQSSSSLKSQRSRPLMGRRPVRRERADKAEGQAAGQKQTDRQAGDGRG